MAWTHRLLRRSTARPPELGDASHSTAPVPPPAPVTREQLLAIFLRLSAILQLTAHIAERLDKFEYHAALIARLAILRARVEAGENSKPLADALTEFGQEFKEFVTAELLLRPR